MGVFFELVSMKFVFLVSLIFACFVSVSFASIPARSNLRFNEVDANNLASNSVSREDIQDYSVGRHQLVNGGVWNSKMGPYAVNSDQVAPGAIPAESQDAAVQIPVDRQAIQPYEAIRDDANVRVDNPSPATSYRVEGKARGSGVILGWYPTQNGHLLRYQSSRALRGIVCSAIDIQTVNRNSGCGCDTDPDANCGCAIDIGYIDTDFNSDFICSGCTVIDCSDPNNNDEDPMCNIASVDQRENPFDADGDVLPDRCSPYTSVSDVNNPQEGVPVYSPTVERITIDDTGRVEMWFFGRGTIDTAHEDIHVTVVVLLDDQYGA